MCHEQFGFGGEGTFFNYLLFVSLEVKKKSFSLTNASKLLEKVPAMPNNL